MTVLLALSLALSTLGTPPPAHHVNGMASWYCCTRGHSAGSATAAAGPALRHGNWRGRWVTVRAARVIRVQLRDWCLCRNGRVIDLHPGPFSRLAPLSRGLVRVTVAWP